MIGWSSDLRSATEGRGVSSLVDQLFEKFLCHCRLMLLEK